MNYNYISKIESITKLNTDLQNQLLRLFARVEIEIKIEIMQLQKVIFHKIKATHTDVDNAILTLSALILAINKITGNPDVINFNAVRIRAKNNKSKAKRQRLIGYWAIVRSLKLEQNMSFRQISEYFSKYHKFSISYSLIYEVWNKLENNKKEEED